MGWALFAAACGLVMGAGCSFDGADRGEHYRCDDVNPCPPGVSCSADGFCEAPEGDAGGSDGGPGGTCTGVPFTDAVRDETLSSENDDWAPSLSADAREIVYFIPAGSTEIYRGVRNGTNVDFSPQGLAMEPNMPDEVDRDPSLSADGMTLYFAAQRDGSLGAHDLFSATRTQEGEVFVDPQRIVSASSDGDDRAPWVSNDGRRLYFVSSRDGDLDIYMAERPDAAGDFDDPAPVTDLNTDSHERSARLTGDELEAFVVSDRPDGEGMHDIYWCRRSQRDDPFDQCDPMTVLNTAFDDTGASPSRDGRYLVANLDTDLEGGRNADVWIATRDCGD